MDNLENLYLSNNNLNDISFFYELELPKIKKITLNRNFIENFYSLTKYKNTIEIIDLNNNNIDKVNCLEDIEFKNLKAIYMTGNLINSNDNSVVEILDKIRNSINIEI